MLIEIFCLDESKNPTKPLNQLQNSRTDSIDAEMSTENTMLRLVAWQVVGSAGAYGLLYPSFDPPSFSVVKVSKGKLSVVSVTPGVVV